MNSKISLFMKKFRERTIEIEELIVNNDYRSLKITIYILSLISLVYLALLPILLSFSLIDAKFIDLGPALTAILTAAIVLLMMFTVIFQRDALGIQKQELNEIRKELKIHSLQFSKQNLDSIFFKLINRHIDNVNTLKLTTQNSEKVQGKDFFEYFYNDIYYKISKEEKNKNPELNLEKSLINISKAYEPLYKKYEHELGYYFRSIYNMFTVIEEHFNDSIGNLLTEKGIKCINEFYIKSEFHKVEGNDKYDSNSIEKIKLTIEECKFDKDIGTWLEEIANKARRQMLESIEKTSTKDILKERSENFKRMIREDIKSSDYTDFIKRVGSSAIREKNKYSYCYENLMGKEDFLEVLNHLAQKNEELKKNYKQIEKLENERRRYISVIRSLLSKHELLVMFYNCLSIKNGMAENQEKFLDGSVEKSNINKLKWYIDKYKVFKIIPIDSLKDQKGDSPEKGKLIFSHHMLHYEKSAYRQKDEILKLYHELKEKHFTT